MRKLLFPLIVMVILLFAPWRVVVAQEMEPGAYLPLVTSGYTQPYSYLEWSQRVIEPGQAFTATFRVGGVGGVNEMEGGVRFGEKLSPIDAYYGNLWPPLSSIQVEPEWFDNHVEMTEIGLLPSPYHRDVKVFSLVATSYELGEVEVAPIAVLNRTLFFTETENVHVVRCVGDFNDDGGRNNIDKLLFFQMVQRLLPHDPTYDINGDGLVGGADFYLIPWYRSCP